MYRRWLVSAIGALWLLTSVSVHADETDEVLQSELRSMRQFRPEYIPSEFSDEDMLRALPRPGLNGERWRLPIEKTSRKDRLLARSAGFAITGSVVVTPAENYLLARRIQDGVFWFNKPVPLDARIVRISASRYFGVYACLLEPGKSGSPGDILCCNSNSFSSARKRIRKPEIEKLAGHATMPWWLTVGPIGRSMVSCGDDGSMHLWNLERLSFGGRRPQFQLRGKAEKTPDAFPKIATFPYYKKSEDGSVMRGEFVAFSLNARWLATAFQGKVSFRDPLNGDEKFTWEPQLPNARRIMAIRFAPDSKSLFAFLNTVEENRNNTLQFLQFAIKEKKERPFHGPRPTVCGMAPPDGQTMITTNGSGEISFWDLESCKETEVLKVAPERLYDMTLSPLGETLVTAGDDGKAKFWDVAERRQKPTEKRYRHEGIDLVQFSADGKYLVTASDDGWLKVWDAPEFTHDRTEAPIKTQIDFTRNLVREVYKDGRVEYRKIHEDEE